MTSPLSFAKKIGKIQQFLSSTPFPHYMFRIPLLILWHIFLLYYQNMQIILSCNSPTCLPSTVPQTISPSFLLLVTAFKTMIHTTEKLHAVSHQPNCQQSLSSAVFPQPSSLLSMLMSFDIYCTVLHWFMLQQSCQGIQFFPVSYKAQSWVNLCYVYLFFWSGQTPKWVFIPLLCERH